MNTLNVLLLDKQLNQFSTTLKLQCVFLLISLIKMNNGRGGGGNQRNRRAGHFANRRGLQRVEERMRILDPGFFTDWDTDSDEEEEEEEDARHANNMMMMMPQQRDRVPRAPIPARGERPEQRVVLPRPQQWRRPNANDDDDEEQQAPQNVMPRVRHGMGNPQRPRQDPTGNIRFANRVLRSAVSWMFTLRLSPDPRRVNYFPDPPTLAGLAQDANGAWVRPYSVPTVNQLQFRPHAPQFIVYQLERGNNGAVDQQGNLIHGNGMHYQGYMEFPNKVSALEICAVMGWNELFGWNMLDVWLEPRAGRREDAIAYVTKDDSAVDVDETLRDFTLGDIDSDQVTENINNQFQLAIEEVNYQPPPDVPIRPRSGEPRPADAVELAKAIEAMINEGASYLDIFKIHPGYALSHPAGIKAAIAAVADAKGGVLAHRDVKTFVFWGDSRTGKTRRIAELEGDENLVMDKNKVYIKSRTEQYYQHYTNQEVLVLDEFVGGTTGKMTIDDFCAILDGSNLSLPIKYESPRFARWVRVYITSNIPPRKWFPNATPEQTDAMYNRLKTGGIIKFVNTNKPASVAAHQAELDSNTYLADRPEVIFKDSTAW